MTARVFLHSLFFRWKRSYTQRAHTRTHYDNVVIVSNKFCTYHHQVDAYLIWQAMNKAPTHINLAFDLFPSCSWSPSSVGNPGSIECALKKAALNFWSELRIKSRKAGVCFHFGIDIVANYRCHTSGVRVFCVYVGCCFRYTYISLCKRNSTLNLMYLSYGIYH